MVDVSGTASKYKESELEKKTNAEEQLMNSREKIINKISNFAVGSLFSAVGVIGGGKILYYGVQSKDKPSIYLGTALLAVGVSATYYCFKKIKKGFRVLKYFY